MSAKYDPSNPGQGLGSDPHDLNNEVKARTLKLRRESKRSISRLIPEAAFQRENDRTLKVDTLLDRELKNMVVTLEREVWSEDVNTEYTREYVSYEVHAGPWQMFKSQYMPRWFNRLLPVRMHQRSIPVERRVTTVAEYPGYAGIGEPGIGPHIIRVYDTPMVPKRPASYTPNQPPKENKHD